ncbi:hypothetical protein AK812_SmicGene5180 [Symbiodinium microadriaticum]|uniref:Uncharacterized protein n=1 Tax=Symbiodinium microadriaticum TaxID=2951 RepID=A0A1Q9EUI5_SYMMI|nr:hypothetical protein AK812_SmicGene5180 [Symbiodinium microadriaticum]
MVSSIAVLGGWETHCLLPTESVCICEIWLAASAACPVKIAGKQRGPWKGSRGQGAQASPLRCSYLRGDWGWQEDGSSTSTVIFCFDSWQDLPGSRHRRDSQLTTASAYPLLR